MSNMFINTEQIKSRDIAKTITSAGGIILALFLGYILYKTTSNDLTHIQRAIDNQTEIMGKVLRENTKAIEGNTKVLEIIERRLK